MKIFIAFEGNNNDNQLVQKNIINKNLIVYSLKDIGKEELEKEMLANNIIELAHVKQRFSIDYFEDKKNTHLAYGILMNVKGIDNFHEYMFFIELFLDQLLKPFFYVYPGGYEKIYSEDNYLVYSGNDKIKIINDNSILKFIESLKIQKQYCHRQRSYIKDWTKNKDKERFRLFTAIGLYGGLRSKYLDGKSGLFGLVELSDISTILENLFTKSEEKEGLGYILRKRIHILLGERISSIEDKIKELYSFRSHYVHGNIYEDIFKSYKYDKDKDDIIEEWLLKYKKGKINRDGKNIFELTDEYNSILRIIILYYLFFDKRIRENHDTLITQDGKLIESVIDLLESAICDKNTQSKIKKISKSIEKYTMHFGL